MNRRIKKIKPWTEKITNGEYDSGTKTKTKENKKLKEKGNNVVGALNINF